MPIEYAESGKFFTDIIKKKPVEVLVQTTHQLLHGYVHIRPDSRLKDEIDNEENSLAITDVTVYGNEGTAVYRSKFMALNRLQIIWIIPYDDLVE